ncbi:hypothetical protein DC498_03410 [Terrimonas sp.]|uniref:hypothetical protein n=1 Tax=Terrimonas sp. TaxID=1914338 RepID=UPI000D50B58E|nr:hypothetical protein [Terrimonas sp.]PVD53579.1 hypothetical protein DC498_03410 [Terrimonas sp.]
MNVSFEKWKHWNAVTCTVGQNTMVIGISAGPRILALRYNDGGNILYEDHTGFGVGAWQMHGGHRFTIAPENDDSYHPDNDPCEVTIEDTAIHITAKQRLNGLALSLVINASPQGGFYVDHLLVNKGSTDWEGALWAITCIPRSHVLSGSCTTNTISFWPGTDASKWKHADGRVTVEDGYFRGKAGWYSAAPELTAISHEGRLTITSPDKTVPELCVDNGSNVEMFVCAGWAELETLSKKYIVKPGGSVAHRQHWQFITRERY